MSPPFWIHCNMCGAQLNKDSKHFLLSCSHIMCKYCLQPTGGKKCPVCNADVRYEEMSKLPEKLKNNFQPNIQGLLQEPLKIIEFQQKHSLDLAKKNHDYKKKFLQAQKIYEQQKAEAMKIQKELEKAIHKRRLMQEKLKQVYMQNQMKKQHEVYRNPANLTLSSNFSIEEPRRSSSPSQAGSNFFDQNSQTRSDFSSSSNDFFEPRKPQTPRRMSTNFEHTQSTRKPQTPRRMSTNFELTQSTRKPQTPRRLSKNFEHTQSRKTLFL